VIGRHGRHHLPRDRRHDRHDHYRQHKAGDEVVWAGNVAAHKRQERQSVPDRVLQRAQLRDHEEDAPQPIDDRGNGREQVDHDRRGHAYAARTQLSDEQRGRDGYRHADHQGDRRGQKRAEYERPRTVDVRRGVPVVVENEREEPELREHRVGFAVEPNEEVDDQREQRDRECRKPPLQKAVGEPGGERPLPEGAVGTGGKDACLHPSFRRSAGRCRSRCPTSLGSC
jgi:hypothetical protein